MVRLRIINKTIKIMTNKLSITDSCLSFENLSLTEMEAINGGSIIYDIYKILKESWPEIKKGFMDARHF